MPQSQELLFFKDEEGVKIFNRLLKHLIELSDLLNNKLSDTKHLESLKVSVDAFNEKSVDKQDVGTHYRNLLDALTKEIIKLDHGSHHHHIKHISINQKAEKEALNVLSHRVMNDTHAINKHVKSQYKSLMSAFVHAQTKLFKDVIRALGAPDEAPPVDETPQ